MPSQPSGIEYRIKELYCEVVSNVLPRRQPPRIPITIPNQLARSVPSPTSTTVGKNRAPIMSFTCSPVRSDCPRSPVSVCRM